MSTKKKSTATNNIYFGGFIQEIISGRQISQDVVQKFILDSIKELYRTKINNENDLLIISSGDFSFDLFEEYNVVEKLEDIDSQISLLDAKKHNPKVKIGEKITIPFAITRFSRHGIQQIASELKKVLANVDNEKIYEEYFPLKGTILTGTVENIDYRYYSLEITPSVRAFIPKAEQLTREPIHPGDKLSFYVLDVFKTHSFSQILGSRKSDEFFKLLMRQEIPELDNETIEITKINREPGLRAKIGLKVNNQNLDAIGTCIGRGGARINAVSTALNNEKIDIYIDQDDPIQLVLHAITPAKVINWKIENNVMKIMVLDLQYPIVIGKYGSAIRLLDEISEFEIEIKIFEQAVLEETVPLQLNGHLTKIDLEKLEVAPELIAKCIDVDFEIKPEIVTN